MNKIGALILGVLALLAAVVIWLLRGRLVAGDVGEAKGRADADRKRVQEKEDAGDDGGVAEEWRRHRK